MLLCGGCIADLRVNGEFVELIDRLGYLGRLDLVTPDGHKRATSSVC